MMINYRNKALYCNDINLYISYHDTINVSQIVI